MGESSGSSAPPLEPVAGPSRVIRDNAVMGETTLPRRETDAPLRHDRRSDDEAAPEPRPALSVRPWGRFVVGVVLGGIIAGIGWVEYLSGPEVGFSLFYLGPILIAGWFLGRWIGTTLAVEAGVVWFLADIGWRSEGSKQFSVWNGLSSLLIFIGITLLISRLQSDRRQLRELLARAELLARTDILTGLPNSRAFHDLLRRGLTDARAAGRSFCLAYLDLDDFKSVNDLYGHEAGDQVLAELAAIVRETIRPQDVVARLGGDEFGIVFLDVDASDVQAVAGRIIARISAAADRFPCTELGASIGLVHLETVVDDVVALERAADSAMYAAKKSGKSRFEIRHEV